MPKASMTKREARMRQRAALGKATADELRALEQEFGVDVGMYQTKPPEVSVAPAPSPETPTDAPPFE